MDLRHPWLRPLGTSTAGLQLSALDRTGPKHRHTLSFLLVAVSAAALWAGSALAQDQQDGDSSETERDNRLITLEDLRRALTQSETSVAEEDDDAERDTDVTPGQAEDGVTDPSPTFTLDDLRRALSGQPASEEATVVAEDALDKLEAESDAAVDAAETDVAETEEPAEDTVTADADAVSEEDAQVDEAESASQPTQIATAPIEPVSSRPSASSSSAAPSEDQSDRAADRSGEPAAQPRAATNPELYSCKLSTMLAAWESDGFEDDTGKLSLYFASAEYALNQASIATLAREAQALQEIVDRGERITIVGNADAVGDESANVILSLQRAYNVKACIIQLIGIPAEYLTISGHGSFSAMLEPPEDTPAGNRRVDIVPETIYQERFEAAFFELNQ